MDNYMKNPIPIFEDSDNEDVDIRQLREQKKRMENYSQQQMKQKQDYLDNQKKPKQQNFQALKQKTKLPNNSAVEVQFKIREEKKEIQKENLKDDSNTQKLQQIQKPQKKVIKQQPIIEKPQVEQQDVFKNIVLQKGVKITNQEGQQLQGDFNQQISIDQLQNPNFIQKISKSQYNQIIQKQNNRSSFLNTMAKQSLENLPQQNYIKNQSYQQNHQVLDKSLNVKQNMLNLNDYNKNLNQKITSDQIKTNKKNGQLTIMQPDMLKQMLLD